MNERFWIEELHSSLNLFSVISRLAQNLYFSFLDSGGGAYRDKLGRYSFIAFDPFLVMRTKGESTWIGKKGRWEQKRGNPFNILRKLLREFDIGTTLSSYPPMLGGGIGYLSYD
ncbi:hypothetical protein H5U35_04205, partial [Candidatus Aerophobetes bacterium]|nr:hypothetical protein [Candidatus Aerophobetes bacterium]